MIPATYRIQAERAYVDADGKLAYRPVSLRVGMHVSGSIAFVDEIKTSEAIDDAMKTTPPPGQGETK
jgi:hypothetical protein